MKPAAMMVLALLMGACSNSEAPKSPPAGEATARTLDVTGIPSELKMLVAPSGTHFHVDNGAPQGATVKLATEFESWLNAHAAAGSFHVTLIETPEDKLIAELLAGKGDIAANVRLTFERDDQVAFAKPLLTHVKEIIVTAPGEKPLVSLEDVGGRSIHVRPGSDHHASLIRLNAQLKGISRPEARIVLTPGTDEDLLAMVNVGKIPATITDDYIFDRWAKTFPAVSANRDVAVSQDGVIAWVTRKDAPALLAAINAFVATPR